MLLFDRRRYLSTSPNHRPYFHWFILVLSSLQLVQYVNSQESDQRVKLTDVQTITLFKDRYTNSRRLNSIPQLRCIGSFWKCQNYAPNVVQCYNKGFDGIDVQWECKADLDKTVKFGMMKVVCEGYSFPDDSYILANSCGLEYSLELSRNRNYDYYNSNLYETSKLSNFLTLLIMVVIILAVYKTCNKNRELELRRELNGTYAHVIDGPGTGGVGDVYASPLSTHHGYGGGYFTSAAPNSGGASSNLFPPPPPPYGSLVMPTSTTGSSTLPTNEVSSATTVAANLSAPSGRLNQPDIEVASAAGAAAQATSVVALGDDKPVDASAAAASQSTAAAAQAAASAALSTNAAASTTPSSTWASFLAGSAAVSGYLLNRRNTSPRRSDSPPPSYEETRTLQAANVNSNSNSNSNSTSNGSNSRR